MFIIEKLHTQIYSAKETNEETKTNINTFLLVPDVNVEGSIHVVL